MHEFIEKDRSKERAHKYTPEVDEYEESEVEEAVDWEEEYE
jgi:hypothetical protein